MGNVKTFRKIRQKNYKKKEIKTMKKNIYINNMMVGGGGKLSVITNMARKGAKEAKHMAKKEGKKQLDEAKDKGKQKMNQKKEELTKKVTDKISGKSGSDKESNEGKKDKSPSPQTGPAPPITSRSPGESPKQRIKKIIAKSKELDADCMKIISDAHESGDYNMSTKDKLELAAVIAAGTALELTGIGAPAGAAMEIGATAAIVDTGAVVATDVAATAVVDGAATAAVDGAATAAVDETAGAAAEKAGQSTLRRGAKKLLDNAGPNDDDDPTKNIKIKDPEKLLKRFKPHFTSDNGKKIYKKLVNCVRQSNNLKKDAIETYRATKNKITCNPKENNPKACGGKGCPDCGDAKCFCPRSATKADQMIEGMQNLMKTTKGPLPYIFLLITKIIATKIK